MLAAVSKNNLHIDGRVLFAGRRYDDHLCVALEAQKARHLVAKVHFDSERAALLEAIAVNRDHAAAIRRVLAVGRVGETYNIGGWNEKPNLEVVHTICDLLDELAPREDGASYRGQIIFVKDRPGHDRRYAIDASKIERELGWRPVETFETGLRKTVEWYFANQDWVQNVTSGAYREWINQHYAEA